MEHRVFWLLFTMLLIDPIFASSIESPIYQSSIPTVSDNQMVPFTFSKDIAFNTWSGNYTSIIPSNFQFFNPVVGEYVAKATDRWVDSSTILAYLFDEGNGSTTAIDSSYYGNNGAIIKNPTWTNGTSNLAIHFNGSNYINNNLIQLPTNALTISLWVNADNFGVGTYRKFLETGTNNNCTIPACYNSSIGIYAGQSNQADLGALSITFYNSTTGLHNVFSVYAVPIVNRWTNFAITWDGSTAIAYVNGVAVRNASTLSFGIPDWANRNLVVGANVYYNEGFNGSLDEVLIYNRSLPVTEIQEIYSRHFILNSTQSGGNVNWTPLNNMVNGSILQYLFEEGSGTNIIDNSGYGNNGTVLGYAKWINGKSGNAIHFDGKSNNKIITPLNLTNGPVSFSLWANADNFSNISYTKFIETGAGNTSTCTIPSCYISTVGIYGVQSPGLDKWSMSASFYNYSSGVRTYVTLINYTTMVGKWNNFIITYDGKYMAAYLNGILNNNRSVSNYGTPDWINTTFNLGGNFYGTENFNGSLDEFIVYNRSLTPQEVQQIYSSNITINPKGNNITWTPSNPTANDILTWSIYANNSYTIISKDYSHTDYITNFSTGAIGTNINATICTDLMKVSGNWFVYPEGLVKLPKVTNWNYNIDGSGWTLAQSDYKDYLFCKNDTINNYDSYNVHTNYNTTVNVSIDFSQRIIDNKLNIGVHQDLVGGYSDINTMNNSLFINETKNSGVKILRTSAHYLPNGWYSYSDPSLGINISNVHSPCVWWNATSHSCGFYNWTVFDNYMNYIKTQLNATPLIRVGDGETSTNCSKSYYPAFMPTSITLDNHNGTHCFPVAEDFSVFFADIAVHLANTSVTPAYMEVMNEPSIFTPSNISWFLDLYNKTRIQTNISLQSTGKVLGKDILIGVNYIDLNVNVGNTKVPVFSYVINNSMDLDFGSVHAYPASGSGLMYYNNSNIYNIYNLPDDTAYNWKTDPWGIYTMYLNTQYHGASSLINFSDMKSQWLTKFGHDLPLLNTEANMNAVYQNGTDPRQQNVISAIDSAIMMKNYALNGFELFTFFTLSGVPNIPGYMTPYGAFGFAAMNFTSPFTPYAPYWGLYLWNKFITVGSSFYNSTISDPDQIDILPIANGDNYSIMIINKVNTNTNISFHVNGLNIHGENLYILDQQSYVQTYHPGVDPQNIFDRGYTTIDKSNISNYTIDPSGNSFNIQLNGYSVAYIQLTPKLDRCSGSCNPGTICCYNTYEDLTYTDGSYATGMCNSQGRCEIR